MKVKAKDLDQGYAIVVLKDKEKCLAPVLGKDIGEGLACVYYESSKTYSIIVIGTGMKVNYEVLYDIDDVDYWIENKMYDMINKLKQNSKLIKDAKRLYEKLIKENRWSDGKCKKTEEGKRS